MGILKYRLACTLSGTKTSKDELYSLTSPTFTVRGWNCYICLNFQTLPTGNTICRSYLPYPQIPIIRKENLQCSYYLLNIVTGDHYKLVNLSPYTTEWCEIGFLQNRFGFLVIIEMDLNEPFAANSTCWLEGRIEMLDKINMSFPSSSPTVIDGLQHYLELSFGGTRKALFITGLRKDVFVNVKFSIYEACSNGICVDDRQVSLRAGKTEYFHDDERFTTVKILSIFAEFKKVNKSRISEIAKMIRTIEYDSPMSYTIVIPHDQVKLKISNSVQQPQQPENSSTTSTPSTNCAIEESMDNSSSRNSTPQPTGSALPEQLKMMYTCYKENKFCDITIQLRDGHEIRAHKNMLFIGSAVWRQLLTEDDQLSIISVTDFEMETIESLITFIYIESVPKPPKQTDQLLIAAETYGIDGLKTWCEHQLINTITIDTVITLLVLAHRYNAKTLFDETWTFVRKNTAELSEREEWKSAFFSYPELGLKLFKNFMTSS